MSLLDDREKTHGNFASVAATAQHLKDYWRSLPSWPTLTAIQREALDSKAVKLARILNGDPNVLDHWEDDAGYSELAARELRPTSDTPKSAFTRATPLSEILHRVDKEIAP